MPPKRVVFAAGTEFPERLHGNTPRVGRLSPEQRQQLREEQEQEPQPQEQQFRRATDEEAAFDWGNYENAVPDFVLDHREPTGEEFAAAENDVKNVRKYYDEQLIDIYGTENGTKLIDVAKHFLRERRPNSAEIAPFYAQALYSHVRDIGPTYINNRITREQFYDLVMRATAKSTKDMVEAEEARRSGRRRRSPPTMDEYAASLGTPPVQFSPPAQNSESGATPVKVEPRDDDEEGEPVEIDVANDVPIDILYPRWARGRLLRPTREEMAEREKALEVIQASALAIIAEKRPDVSEDQMVIAHNEIWDDQDKLYEIPAMSAQIWKSIGRALRLKTASKEEFFADVKESIDREWPTFLRYLIDEANKDDAELAAGAARIDESVAIERQEAALAAQRQQQAAEEAAVERASSPSGPKPVRFSGPRGPGGGGGANGAAGGSGGGVVFGGGNFGQRMAAARAVEKAAALAKARAYWSAHPNAEGPDKRRTAKMVYKADKYTPNKNDFPGVDTRPVGIKEGFAKARSKK